MEGQILMFICVLLTGKVSGLEIDHWGRHFVLSFITTENRNTVKNIVGITAREITEVRVVFHQTGAEEKFNITSGSGRIITYDDRVTLKNYTTVSTKMAISVESSKPVSVYAYVFNPEKSEGFLVLPVASLGISYMTVTYEDAQNTDNTWGTQIVLIAVEGDTELTVELPKDNNCLLGKDNWEAKRSLSFRMDSYDVVNIMCERDTTGTLIVATKTVAVLSGAKRIRLEAASKYHPIVEMLPPITEFGTEYKFVGPGGHTRRCMIRVVALDQDTTFDFNGGRTLTKSGAFVDIFVNQSEPVCFNANKPVKVALFMTGRDVWQYDNYTGNAFMSIIPPVTKFSNEYMVPMVLNIYSPNFVNRVDIVHKKGTESLHVPNALCGNYVVTKFNSSGIFHIQSTTSFLALVYGYAFKDGYGFPAGMKLTDFTGRDECISSPCQNGGWCLEVGSSFRCYCRDSRYTGIFCETDLAEPDQNNPNTTTDLPASFTAKQGSTDEVSTSRTPPTVTAQETPATQKTTFTAAEMAQTTIKPDTPSTNQPTITTNMPSTKQIPPTSTEIQTLVPTTMKISFTTTESPPTKQPDITTPPTKQVTTLTDTSTTGRMPTTQTFLSTGFSTDSGFTIPIKYSPIYKPTDAPLKHESKLKPKPYCSKLPCMCSCPCKKSYNSSRALESSEEMKKTLKVDKTTLSKTFRKKNSSTNLKIVEEEIGQSSFMIVLLPFACLILSDLCKIVYWLLARYNRRTTR